MALFKTIPCFMGEGGREWQRRWLSAGWSGEAAVDCGSLLPQWVAAACCGGECKLLVNGKLLRTTDSRLSMPQRQQAAAVHGAAAQMAFG